MTRNVFWKDFDNWLCGVFFPWAKIFSQYIQALYRVPEGTKPGSQPSFLRSVVTVDTVQYRPQIKDKPPYLPRLLTPPLLCRTITIRETNDVRLLQ